MRIVTQGALLVVMLTLAGCCPKTVTLAVAPRAQQTSMWCWAASGEMCMAYLGTNVSQCDQANHRFGRNDCCNNPTPDECVNGGGWPEFDQYGFTFRRTWDTPLSWAQVRKEICRNRPFVFTWHWNGSTTGHMMVARGFKTVDGIHYVFINDPLNADPHYVTYDAYVSGAEYTHWDDFYQIKRE